MKRAVSTILSLMVVFLSMTGCSDKSNNTNPSSMDWTSNPFSTDIIDEGTTLDGGYGFGMINPVEKITYEGNSVEIPFWFKNNVVPIDVGIYIFIDGVAQQYSIKNADESADLLKHISLKKEEQKEITLSFTPTVGEKGDTLELNILTLMNPLYTPQGENKSFGNQHAALPSMPIKISYQADTINEYPKIMLNDNMKNISAETIKTYQINAEELANTVRLFDDSENIENSILFSKGNNFDLSIAAYGNNATKYRTTVFVNHKPIKTIDEISVFDFEIKKDYLSEIKFQVDSNSLDDNNFVYAISVPLTNSTNSRIIKTQSTLLTCQSEAKSPSVQPEKSTSEQTQSIEMNGLKFENFNENGAPFTYIEFARKNKAYAATSSELLLIDTLTKNVIAKAALPKQMGMRQFYHLDNGVGLAYTTSEAVNKSKEFVVEKALPSNAYYIAFDENLKQTGSEIDLTEPLIQDDSLLTFNTFSVSKDGKMFAFVNREDGNSTIYACKATNPNEKKAIKSVDSDNNSEVSSFSAIQFIDNKTIAFTGYGTVDNKKAQGLGTVGIDGSGYVQNRNDTVEVPQTAGGIALWGDKNVELRDQSSGTVTVINNGAIIQLQPKTKNESQNCYLSNDGKYYATYQITNSNEVTIALRIYEIASGKLIKEIIEQPKGASFNHTGVYGIALDGEGKGMLVQYQFGEKFQVHQYKF